MKKLLLLLLFCCFVLSSFPQTYIEFGFDSFQNTEYVKVKIDSDFIKININELDFHIIPILIDNIDNENVYSCVSCMKKMDIYSSYIPTFYKGEVLASYIERIINPDFKYNRIAKNGFVHSLKVEDLKIIKDLYLKWWDENKQLSKEEITSRRKNQGALDGTIYSWSVCPAFSLLVW